MSRQVHDRLAAVLAHQQIGEGGWSVLQPHRNILAVFQFASGKPASGIIAKFRSAAGMVAQQEALGGYAFDVLVWHLRYKLAVHDLPEMLALRGIVFSYEAVREWEAKLTLALAENHRRRRRGKADRSWHGKEIYLKVDERRRYLYRAGDRTGALVFSERRDMAAARALFRSAKAVTDIKTFIPSSLPRKGVSLKWHLQARQR